ncbi:MAG: hypothetical protein OXN90_20730 [Gemmatimonadota bacterium]|nr:hypothetical protein [Gemmatimonadota bacterium]
MILMLAIGILLSTVNNYAETPTQHAPTALRCGTPYVLQAMDAASELNTEHQRLKLVQQRPSTQHSLLTPSGLFRVHYDSEGRNAVDPDDDDGNGIPDYIDLAAAVLDSTWELEVEQLGYNPPPSDNGLGGGDEYDVYIIDLSRGGCLGPVSVYGCAYPGTSGTTTHSHLEIDNNFTDSSYVKTRGLDALRVTIAHEFHHAIQFGYYALEAGNWWQESTSTWMEEVAYPHIDDYLQYLIHFLGEPQRALNSGRPGSNHTYGSAIFSLFLHQRYGRELNRLIWEELKERESIHLDHFDRVIRQVEPRGLGVVMGEFAVWNYFTGTRHRDEYYAEGDKYPSVLTRGMDVSTVVVRDTSLIDATGSVYLRLKPQLRPGGVNLFIDESRGAWRRHLLLVGPDSVSVQLISEPTIRISSWDQFDEIVLVTTSAERTGLAYKHLFTTQFDPDLTNAPVALATLLKPNYPNPFRLGQHSHTRLAFDLAFPSRKTRLALFAANGTLVWDQDLGERAARADHAVLWDGRNAAGNLVASGIYHLLLEADGTAAKRTIAVVRD